MHRVVVVASVIFGVSGLQGSVNVGRGVCVYWCISCAREVDCITWSRLVGNMYRKM